MYYFLALYIKIDYVNEYVPIFFLYFHFPLKESRTPWKNGYLKFSDRKKLWQKIY